MDASKQDTPRPALKPQDIYRPRLGAQNPPRWKTAMAEQQAWRAMSSPSICPSLTPGADSNDV
jgi:hypothetical protein